MALTRYQIRNEYGLADKELFESTDKEDAEALLEGSSMAGLVGVLRQLGDLAEFAGEVFNCLHEELTTTAARGQGLATRLQQLEAEVPNLVEIPILSQTDHSTFYYDPGLEWHSNLQTEENLISPHKLPHCIMDSYEECRGPPQLFLLDKFDVDGSGSCLKRYSDPSLLKTLTASAVFETSKLSKDERPRKTKKKASHTSNGERLGDSQKSHAKLNQLFLLEHVENGHVNPEFHVKLKRRHLDGPPMISSSGTGYMEKFLKSSLSYCERVHGTLDQSSSAMKNEVTACNVREDLSISSLANPSHGDTRKEREMEYTAADERRERPMICLEKSSTVNLCSKSNDDTDAPASIESEGKEISSSMNFCGKATDDTDAPASTESEGKEISSSVNFCGKATDDTDASASADSEAKESDSDGKTGDIFGQTQICTNADATHTDVLAQFSKVLYHSSEEGESHLLKLTQVPLDASEGGAKALQTNYVENQFQNVYSVETSSEMSLTALVEDQFSSMTNQEIEIDSDCLLQNQHISTFDNFEDISLDADAVHDNADAVHDNAVPQKDETYSQDESSVNTEQYSGHISNFETSSEVGTLLSDTPRHVHTENMIPSASSWQEDSLANSDLDEISSDSGQEDPQTMSIIADGSSELEVQIPDTQRDDTVFAGDSQPSLNDKASETVLEVDLENISDPQECLLGTQECFSPEYYIQTHGQGQESPSEKESENPTEAAAESLPTQDFPLDVHCSPSEETLVCNEKPFPSSEAEIEALNAPHQGTITSLNGNISESILSMDPADQENGLDVSTSLHETPQADPEITHPLPPLPPTQWLMGKLVGESVKTTENQCSSVPSLADSGNNNLYIHRDENTHNGLVKATEAQDPSEASVTSSENHNSHVYTVEAVSTSAQKTLSDPFKATEEKQSRSESVASLSRLTAEATIEAESTEGLEALEWFSQNLKEHINPNLGNLEEEPQLDHPVEPPGETERDNNSYEQNEKVEKLPRDKDTLVIGIDKSMLRKVSERNRTQLGARVEENDSLLEIIRSKSFNLRPADASVRHNFQVAVPITNLKVAAILEKANSLRHAMAGSDDDQDSDTWSE